MGPADKTTDFAQITGGFLAGLNALGPLIRGLVEYQGQDSPPSMFLHLQNPEKKILVAPGQVPMVSRINGDEPEANFYAKADSEMFHYMVWGRLSFAKALNEKLLLTESRLNTPPEDQPALGMPGGPLLFNNVFYEMYLIRIGAEHLITADTTAHIPLPGEGRPIKEIRLIEVPGGIVPRAAAHAFARCLGWILGLVLRVYLRWRKDEDLEAPLEYSSVPEPRPENPPPSSGAKLAIMKVLFRRIDVFSVLDNLVKGIMATGPFEKRR